MPHPNRRAFLVAAAALAAFADQARSMAQAPKRNATSPGTLEAIEQAESLIGVSFSAKEREQLARTLEEQRSILAARRSRGWLPNTLAPATTFDPRLPGTPVVRSTPTGDPGVLPADGPPLPANEHDVAFAPAWVQSRWIRSGAISSAALTDLSLKRLKAADPRLHCVITLTEDLARRQAAAADRDAAAGRWRGPLHGVPWGCKDIIDTANIRTTWGAEPWRDRVPTRDAVVVERLNASGAVMVAKLAVGALAYGDIWFGGKSRNPWDPERGSSGSSAGSASATAAGLVGFSLGTETLGSIVSPSMECGTVGLRPTFGRVARTGCMALCWSLDKIGAICRDSRDAALVLSIINGGDVDDASSIDEPFVGDPGAPIDGLRVGVVPAWIGDGPTADLDRATIERLRERGALLVERAVPDLPYQALMIPLLVEAAAAFEELTRADLDDQLAWQEDEAWPNTFRRTWLLPAIELIQADRFRREVMIVMRGVLEGTDALVAPSFARGVSGPLMIANSTGHPSITVPTDLLPEGRPHGITAIGHLFDEATLCRIGGAIEENAPIRGRRPPGA